MAAADDERSNQDLPREATQEPEVPAVSGRRLQHEQAVTAMRGLLLGSLQQPDAGRRAIASRSEAVDALIRGLWADAVEHTPRLATGVALVAVGGYGRRELFPYSDVDLMFLLNARTLEGGLKDPIRALNQAMWDSGLRVSPMTRTLADCERFDPENVEFTLSLLDARALAGDAALPGRLTGTVLPRLLAREGKKIAARLVDVTRTRHARYGNTLFHLEPNVKDCPGGLRDAHVFAWLGRVLEGENGGSAALEPASGFAEAREFLLLVRGFLHLRHERDNNLLDWHVQDEAAAASLGLPRADAGSSRAPDAAYWMRLYFRHARIVERTAAMALEAAVAGEKMPSRLPGMATLRRLGGVREAPGGFQLRRGRVVLAEAIPGQTDPAHDSEVMLGAFTAVAETGARLSVDTERRLENALPRLSADLEDGPGLWRHLQAILTGAHAGLALRGMHALGILELLVPEFHAIDALVIRDAYHRYTVDEHTFVLIDTLHGLSISQASVSSAPTQGGGLEVWATRFASILRDLPHPGLLYLAALLHDIGKGHSATGHAAVSARIAARVTDRLQLESYEAGLVFGLIEQHLEMSAALRRDVFDAETVRAFAARVPTPEALRMLTLFTYADIRAVHPDALTPWKAENLWRLHIVTANYLDRSVDDERVGGAEISDDLLYRVDALLPGRSAELRRFLDGLPQRYLLTRTAEQVRTHLEMAQRLEAQGSAADGTSAAPYLELDFRYAADFSELTLISTDRPMLFADMAGALAAWGMNVVTADAFSNAAGLVVDSFSFTDRFRTLEMNESERTRFVANIREAVTGVIPAETLLAARRRGRRRTPRVAVPTRIDLDNGASSHSTLLQVVAQDSPGLLRALSLTLAAQGCNIEVALVDTEGEMAIDVFYITRGGEKLTPEAEDTLRSTLLEAIEANAR